MLIKAKQIQSITKHDIALHSALIEGLDYVFEEVLDENVKAMWYNFRELLTFECDIQTYHFDSFVNNLQYLHSVIGREWSEDDAASYQALLSFAVKELHLYKHCISFGVELEAARTLNQCEALVKEANND